MVFTWVFTQMNQRPDRDPLLCAHGEQRDAFRFG